MNFIVNDYYTLPSEIIEQSVIFENQKNKFIDRNNTVSVLSAFPLFVNDYYGNKKTIEKIK